MKLNEYNEWFTGLEQYWIDKIDDATVGSPWIVPVDSSYPSEYYGLPWSNIETLKSQVLSSLQQFLPPHQAYHEELKNGKIYTTFKNNLLSLYTFVSMKYNLRYKDNSSFDIDAVEFPGVESWFSWYIYDLPEYMSLDDLYSTSPIPINSFPDSAFDTDPTVGTQYSSEANLVINTSKITSLVKDFNLNIKKDLENMEGFQNLLTSISSDKILYQIFKSPAPEIWPPKMSASDMILYEYKVKAIAEEMGWYIAGITDPPLKL